MKTKCTECGRSDVLRHFWNSVLKDTTCEGCGRIQPKKADALYPDKIWIVFENNIPRNPVDFSLTMRDMAHKYRNKRVYKIKRYCLI